MSTAVMWFVRSLVLLTVALAAGLAAAQGGYPTKPIRLIAPFPPGGSGDTTARITADFLQKKWGQTVLVENRAGAGGLTGANDVKHAAPDGYTLMLGLDSMATFPIFLKDNTIDLARDFAPVSLLDKLPTALLASTGVPGNTPQDFIAFAKANPGKVNIGYTLYSTSYLAAVLLTHKAGIDAALIPYPGGGPMSVALQSNEVQAVFNSYVTYASAIKAGNAKALAWAAPDRGRQDPRLPTLRESGIDISVVIWYGLFAPLGTPPSVIAKLADASAEMAKTPAVTELMDKIGLEPVGSTPDQLSRTLAETIATYTDAARLGNIQPQ